MGSRSTHLRFLPTIPVGMTKPDNPAIGVDCTHNRFLRSGGQAPRAVNLRWRDRNATEQSIEHWYYYHPRLFPVNDQI
jgi:hypothetical protein